MPVKKVLVVDDSPTERHVLVELLTKNGYKVITAESGEEGIEKAKAELPDLVLMDVRMPQGNGIGPPWRRGLSAQPRRVSPCRLSRPPGFTAMRFTCQPSPCPSRR